MSGERDERLAEILAHREEDPRTAAPGDVEPGLRRALEACSSLERDLATLSLAVQGHPERAGPWVLLRPLGRGTSGTVYLAEREDGSERAAVRFVSQLDGQTLREVARGMITFRHAAVVPVLEVGSGWIATEVSDGVPLSTVLASVRTDPTADPEETRGPLLRSLAPVAEAIDAAHLAGLVHGGISPRRLDLSRDGSIRLRDFGFDPTRTARPPTPESPPLGSALHLAPEQVRPGGEVGPATDVYAFASVVRTVAAGSPPHGARSLTELLRRIRDEDVREPPSHVSKALRASLAPCLAREPSARPENLAALTAALRDDG